MTGKKSNAIISLVQAEMLGSDSIFLSSSMAEHSAVNRRVVSSSLTWGAIEKAWKSGLFLFALQGALRAMGTPCCLYEEAEGVKAA